MDDREQRQWWMRRLSLLFFVFAMLGGAYQLGWFGTIDGPSFDMFEPSPTHLSPEEAPETVSFELRNEDAYFLARRPDGGRRTARTVDELPVWQRAAAGVHVEGETPRVGGTEWLYVANLLGARPGDDVVAHLQTRRAFERAQRAAILGGGTALQWLERLETRAEARSSPNDTNESDEREDDERERHVEVERLKSGQMTIDRLDESSNEDEGSWGTIEVHRVDEVSASDGRDSPSDPRRGESASTETSGSTYRSVVLFGADWCPSCKRAKRWMERHDVPYTYRNIGTSTRAKREMARLCRQHGVEPGGIPTLEIGGDDLMQGWNAERFQRLASR